MPLALPHRNPSDATKPEPAEEPARPQLGEATGDAEGMPIPPIPIPIPE
eukprot:COSAG01_NODE_62328_length_285_cov_0.827957_1_plen_48_part_10